MSLYSLAFSCFFLLSVAQFATNAQTPTPVNTCKDGPLPAEVFVNDCVKLPCTFYTLAVSSFSLNFTSPRYLEKLTPKVIAHVLGIDFPYPLPQKDACEGILNTPCPLAENELISYSYGMYLDDFPEVSLTLEFSIVDQEVDENIVCFMVDVLVKKKLK